MTTEDLKAALNDWTQKVLTAHSTAGITDTFAMIRDVDKIIAEAFDHDQVIE